jgi:hypothetical protein
VRFGEKDTKESLLDLARRMLEVFHAKREPGAEVVAVEQPFDVPLIDLDTGEILDRALIGTLDLVERDAEGRIVVVDLKTAARKYDNLQVDASLQLSVYSYATSMNGLGDQEDLRLRFDVLTKTKQPELHRTGRSGTARRASGCSGWWARCCARSRLACSIPTRGGNARTASSAASAGRGGRRAAMWKEVNAMLHVIPRSGSRKVNGYVNAVLALEAVRKKRETCYERFVRPLDRRRDQSGGRGRNAAPDAERRAARRGAAVTMIAQAMAAVRRSCGPKPPTRSWPASLEFVIASLGQDTRSARMP